MFFMYEMVWYLGFCLAVMICTGIWSWTIGSRRGINRSSHRMCHVKKGVLKSFANFIGKHLRWSLFLIKLQGETPTHVSFCEIFKNASFEEQLRTTANLVFLKKTWNSRKLPWMRVFFGVCFLACPMPLTLLNMESS